GDHTVGINDTCQRAKGLGVQLVFVGAGFNQVKPIGKTTFADGGEFGQSRFDIHGGAVGLVEEKYHRKHDDQGGKQQNCAVSADADGAHQLVDILHIVALLVWSPPGLAMGD